jgi:hypothetical protein
VHCNPITRFDPLGLYFKSETSPDGSKTHFTYTASVLFDEGLNYTDDQIEQTMETIKAGIIETFEGAEGDHTWDIDVTLDVAQSASEIPEDNHIIRVRADTEVNDQGKVIQSLDGSIGRNTDVDGNGQIGGRVSHYVPGRGYNEANNFTKDGKIIGHETGHVAGLEHQYPSEDMLTGKEKMTVMFYLPVPATELSSDQVQQIQDNYDSGKINLGVAEPGTDSSEDD